MPEFDSTIEYRDIPGFPGYRVGGDGSVWSRRLYRKRQNQQYQSALGNTWHKIHPYTAKNGYLRLYISLRAKPYRFSVHRLVLTTFVGACPKGMQCCHNNSIKSDNRLCNLRWDTPKSNMADHAKHSGGQNGEKSPVAKLTEKIVRQIRKDYIPGVVGQRRLAKKYGVVHSTIRRIVSGEIWTHLKDESRG